MELQTDRSLVARQNVISMTSLSYENVVIFVTVTYLLRHWYRSMADKCMPCSLKFSMTFLSTEASDFHLQFQFCLGVLVFKSFALLE